MNNLTQAKTREIIDDFAQEISDRKFGPVKPDKTVIHFRNERRDSTEREIHSKNLW